MAERIDLSIIIVSWNSAAYVRKCLASVYANTKGLAFEVFVIDNASFDGCGEIVRTEFPQVKFIQSQENLGFARANNLGFDQSTGRNLLFLNPDTEIVGTAINSLLSSLDSTRNAGIVGPMLLCSDLSIDTASIQRFPTITNEALDAEYLKKLWPKSRLWGIRPLLDGESTPTRVDVIPGACMMLRRDVFENVGMFNTDYFMYTEDVDLCFKVNQAGWGTYYVADAMVIHHGGRSCAFQPDNNFANLKMRESRLKFMRLRRGKLYAAAYRSTIAVVAILRLCLLGSFMALTMGRFRRPSLQGACDKWMRILRWSVCF